MQHELLPAVRRNQIRALQSGQHPTALEVEERQDDDGVAREARLVRSYQLACAF